MKVAVIGAAGAMGSFFTRYFHERGDEVVRSDIRRAKLRGARVAPSAEAAAKSADVVLVATPLMTTASVCRRVAARMRDGSLLVEISSVKGSALNEIKESAKRSRVRLLSIHPLFGPSLRRHRGMRIAVIADAGAGALREAKRLFPEARLIPMNAEAHDALMSVMLSLTHIVNIAYARVVSDTISPDSFREIASPSFALQSALAEGVLSQDPSLIADIQAANHHTTLAVRGMALEILRLNEMLETGDKKAFYSEFGSLARLFSAGGSSMKKVYRAYEALVG